MRATGPPALQADRISWRNDLPVWVDQWPLPKKKLEAALALVQEQLAAGHIEPSTSPWNTPIFVIQKRSGKWRLLHDLRAVNKTMIPMGALQPGLPSPVAIPQDFSKITIDLKDCFFSIPLHPSDCQRFAFSVPITNCVGPSPRFQWKVLPQGMANSPTLCQKYVAQTIDPFRLQYPKLYIIHYMDDILLAGPNNEELTQVSQELIKALEYRGLNISPDKVQTCPPQLFLGFELLTNRILSQKVRLRVSHLCSLNDFQKLLGELNWLRPYLKITTGELRPLFDILKGDSDPNSPRSLTPEARKALALIEQAIHEQHIGYYAPQKPLWFLIFSTTFSPTGLLWQGHPLFWIHMPATPTKILSSYPHLTAGLLRLGREAALRLFGREPDHIVCPYTASQIQWLLQNDDDWAVNCISYMGAIDNHYPSDKLIQFFQKTPVVFPRITKAEPIESAHLAFTDGSATGKAAFSVDGQVTSFDTPFTSAQLVELAAVIKVFESVSGPLNVYTDSSYIAQSVPLLETVPYIRPSTNASPLFATLQLLILSRDHPFFIGHIRAHSDLPGPLSEGNDQVDQVTRRILLALSASPVEAATQAHKLHHLNAHTLRLKFPITREQARQIVKQCPGCLTLLPEPHNGINPRGLIPGELWQMDVTHYPPFGRLKYVHVSIDTFSGFIFATLQPGEATKHVINHLLSALAVLPQPKILKTDNGPGYTSSSFRSFCAQLHIKHVTGIPYNPQGQGIVERAHQTLKNMVLKLQSGREVLYPRAGNAKTLLNHALFVLNFLTLDTAAKSAADRLWHSTTAQTYAQAKWKDPLLGKWQGPDPVLIWGKGHACIYDSKCQNARWLPERLIRLMDKPETHNAVQGTTPP